MLGASFELTHGYYPFAEALGQVLFFEQRRSSDADDLLGKRALHAGPGQALLS